MMQPKSVLILVVMLAGSCKYPTADTCARAEVESSATSDDIAPLPFAVAAQKQYSTPSLFPLPKGCGTGFSLSIDYPKSFPSEPQPWRQINFRKEPERYLNTVLAYVLEGNVEADWNLRKNSVRRWYHAPWMHYGFAGREPIHGLTLERRSRPGELDKSQTRLTNNWAVGFYNSLGGYTLGRVWADPVRPDTQDVQFPIGTVAAKLLFTDATPQEVPFLKGTKTWYALIRPKDEAPRIAKMRLLQVDVAVRDDRAEPTGWIFGTFIYNAKRPGRTPWQRLQPIGLQWGNDPKRTAADFEQGRPLQEGWLNPEVAARFRSLERKWLGLWGRLNGPVDNPKSSCGSCHARAMDLGATPVDVPFEPDLSNQTLVEQYFRNRRSTEPFYDGYRPLDYSLQLAGSLFNYRDWVKSTYPEQKEDIYGKTSAPGTPGPSRSPAPMSAREFAGPAAEAETSPFLRGGPEE